MCILKLISIIYETSHLRKNQVKTTFIPSENVSANGVDPSVLFLMADLCELYLPFYTLRKSYNC